MNTIRKKKKFKMTVKVYASELNKVFHQLNGEESRFPESFNLLYQSLTPVKCYYKHHHFYL